jgi:hypothetical protein
MVRVEEMDVVMVLATSESGNPGCDTDTDGDNARGLDILHLDAGSPVKAVQISSTWGDASDHGTMKRGLSQRLWVLGSS